MELIIRQAAREGATVVRFPEGKWKWYDLTCLQLPPRPMPIERDFDSGAPDLEEQIRQWITEHKIKAVQIAIDADAPAKLFFKAESILSDLKLPYAVIGGAKLGQGRILLSETDGRVQSQPVQNHKGEQGVAPQSATRSESDLEGEDKPQPESEPRPR